MKKVLSIVVALCMMMALTVTCFAWSEDHIFFTSSNWKTDEIEDAEGFLEALQEEGAVLAITRSAESGVTEWVTGTVEEGGQYENFALIDSWYTGTVWLGTAGHNSEDEPDKGMIDCLSDDGLVVTYDANAVYEAYVAAGCLDGGTPTLVICTSAEGVYNVTNISVYVPEGAAEETTEEAEASEASEAEETAEASESTETSTASSPDTGVALALVPMAIAGIAVVSSKRR